MWRYVCNPYEDPECGRPEIQEEPDYDWEYDEAREEAMEA